MHKECFNVINNFQKNDNIIITKPDKGSGIFLLNKSNYVNKMEKILDHELNDNTDSVESCLQKQLLDLVKAELMLKWIYDAIQPTGLQRLSNVWFAENTQRRHSTSLYTVYDRFVPS